MCGRYLLTTPIGDLSKLFGFIELPNLSPSWNIAPTHEAPVVRAVDDSRTFAKLRWGLVPNWARPTSSRPPLINARGETIAEKPSFKESFNLFRCLVPADGFFEWRGKGSTRQAFFADPGETVAFAGLWATSQGPDGKSLETFTIVTTEANKLLKDVHHRMPVVIPPDAFDIWLKASTTDAASLIQAAPEDRFRLVEVDRRVGNVNQNDPDLLKPAKSLSPMGQLKLF